ncbi:hypothetical protein Tco_0750697 [Tanacetum coccineum]|uniref:Uncharacterized protein n=1 Tax=Tanacetum coccineum TaxID=301880 RepID=A0ABQ4Z325_9ASTR
MYSRYRCPLQEHPGSNVPLIGVPSKNTWAVMYPLCSLQEHPGSNLLLSVQSIEVLRNHFKQKEADEPIDKITVVEKENECLLRALVSQDIMSIVRSHSVIDTSNLQNDLERTKEKLETCVIKKENEYAVIWNKWYKKYEECKYDKILYDKAYNDMQHQITVASSVGRYQGKEYEYSVCIQYL